MKIIPEIASMQNELIEIRRDIHAHPETAFEEHRTSDLIVQKLKEWGLEVHQGLAETGVVGTLKGKGGSSNAIGLRCDIDALPMSEETNLPHSSKHEGKMHACGHDGHTTMLLGAAKYLSETRNFDGTVHFIFQPAEETAGGGRRMVQEGLFDKFPVQNVYGMHNWPSVDVGKMVVLSGPFMAGVDIFQLDVIGKGCHAAMPHLGIDPIVIGSQIVTGLQNIASRQTHPVDAVVVTVTQFHAGDAWNVIPEKVMLRGTVRTFKKEVQEATKSAMQKIAEGIAAAHSASIDLRYMKGYPPTVNNPDQADFNALVASDILGEENIIRDALPTMGAEDFSYMLNEVPGAMVWLGAGEDSAPLHSPHYDFNDDLLPIGATYWSKLVETRLGFGGS